MFGPDSAGMPAERRWPAGQRGLRSTSVADVTALPTAILSGIGGRARRCRPVDAGAGSSEAASRLGGA
jgi:hypothetical protein